MEQWRDVLNQPAAGGCQSSEADLDGLQALFKSQKEQSAQTDNMLEAKATAVLNQMVTLLRTAEAELKEQISTATAAHSAQNQCEAEAALEKFPPVLGVTFKAHPREVHVPSARTIFVQLIEWLQPRLHALASGTDAPTGTAATNVHPVTTPTTVPFESATFALSSTGAASNSNSETPLHSSPVPTSLLISLTHR